MDTDELSQHGSDSKTISQNQSATHLRLKLLAVAMMMFGVGFAMAPLYKMFCEITGVNVLANNTVFDKTVSNSQVDRSRKITVVFDSNSGDQSVSPFRFRPTVNSIQMHPGEVKQVIYEVVNKRDNPIQAQAIPSYLPKIATRYFKKMECFCFKEQTLKPHEGKQMPVVFVIDPALPKQVTTITLSYTFFETGHPVINPIGPLAKN